MHIQHVEIKKLLELYKEISLLGHIKSILGWDLNVNLPPKAAQERALQSAYLEERVIKLWLDKEFRLALEKANGVSGLTAEELAMLRNLNKGAKFYYNVPPDIITKREQVTSRGFMAWREAREKNNYKTFLPDLKEILEINRIIAGLLGYKKNPYDALLDMYEPELTADFTEKTFTGLKKELVTLLKKIRKSKSYVEENTLVSGNRKYGIDEQRKIGAFVMRKMGYDMQAGRVDESAHPFTTSLGRNDVRITTRFNEKDFRESYTSYVHETGHAIYEQGINPDYSGTPLEGGVSLGIHEAMSRFWENMVGRDPAFLQFLSPVFQSFFPDQLGNVSEDDITRSLNFVKPGHIRIESDEVTYSLHIILRFEMENELINEKITLEDAPEVWREKSKHYLGIVPEKDSDGILQDVHWSYGAVGYFPSYALGNVYGAQLLDKMKKKVKFDEDLQKGQLANINTWLRDTIYQHGSFLMPRDLLQRATGEDLNYMYFVNYLNDKYSAMYLR